MIRTEPSSYSRRVLVCAAGLSPQVVTETLFALAIRTDKPFIPTELHIVGSFEGIRRAKLQLIDRRHGKIWEMLKEYKVNASGIRVGADTLHEIRSANGSSIDDLQTPDDHAAVADFVTELVRDLTRDDGAAIHLSLAGGRKTLGFLLGYALSLFGRPQDRLSHVLTSEPFVSLPDFFYPPRKPKVILNGKVPVDTADARITLVDIPFVRLRNGLDRSLLKGAARYSETVRRAQMSLDEVRLVIRSKTRSAVFGSTEISSLAPIELAWLSFFAGRASRGEPAINWRDIDADDFLSQLSAIAGPMSQHVDRSRGALKFGMTAEYFGTGLSRLKSALQKALGLETAKLYMPAALGKRPKTAYKLLLGKGQISWE